MDSSRAAPPFECADRPRSETLQVLEARSSVRSFRDEPVNDELLNAILQAACRAPTSSNIQAYSIIVVRDRATRARLAEIAGGQAHVAAAPVFLAVCADLARAGRACELRGKALAGDSLEMGLVAAVDASLVGMSIMLAAESLGLGCVMIGGLRNQPVDVARALGLPPRVFAVFGMCMGWPAERPPQKPRMPEGAVIHFERYDAERTDAVLAQYDESLHRHYQGQGRAAAEPWTARVSVEFSKPRRTDLRAHLQALGFPLE
jgi:nitroreductase